MTAQIVRPAADLTIPKPLPMVSLSPHEMAFAWDRCKRCFWEKLHRLSSKELVFPPVLGATAKLMESGISQDMLKEFGIETICPLDLPYVRSEAYNRITVSAKPDHVFVLPDGKVLLVDDKMTNSEKLTQYERQLSLTAWAIENPEQVPEGSKKPQTPAYQVGGIGLITFSPEKFDRQKRVGAIVGTLNWVPFKYDRQATVALLEEVMAVYSGPCPNAAEYCETCRITDDKLRARQRSAK